MPMIRNGTTDTNAAAKLVEKLASEIQNPNVVGQPQIFENRISQTQRYTVTVIWDEWSQMTQQARSRIILDAYEVALPQRNGQIAFAMGLTTDDASSMGILPFAIVPMLKKAEAPMLEKITEAFRKEGASKTANGLTLKFRTLEDAEAAFARLQAAVPGQYWVITQEIQPVS